MLLLLLLNNSTVICQTIFFKGHTHSVLSFACSSPAGGMLFGVSDLLSVLLLHTLKSMPHASEEQEQEPVHPTACACSGDRRPPSTSFSTGYRLVCSLVPTRAQVPRSCFHRPPLKSQLKSWPAVGGLQPGLKVGFGFCVSVYSHCLEACFSE